MEKLQEEGMTVKGKCTRWKITRARVDRRLIFVDWYVLMLL